MPLNNPAWLHRVFAESEQPGSNPWSQEVNAAIDDALITVMSRTLDLPSRACQESALHGLGHWQSADPDRIARIIDRWLDPPLTPDPLLLSYAHEARRGHVQ